MTHFFTRKGQQPADKVLCVFADVAQDPMPTILKNCKWILKDVIAPLVFGHVVRLANSTVRPCAEAVGQAFEAPGVGS
ncbi:hypothetical protein MRX96_023322 [Rhipicephalus microplus]